MINIYELLRRNQDETAKYVTEILDNLKVPYFIDGYGNIYNLDKENVPLLSAHMDTVRKQEDFCIGSFLTENETDKIFSGGILGGDDKCGVYIILKALEEGKDINFIFSRDEEIGCLGIKALLKPSYKENKEIADKVRKCLWCLVLDRRGNSDIICYNNGYGTLEFQKALEKISEENNFGYQGNTGLCSDANTIRDFVSTANISVGYYNPHSQKEYIDKKDLAKAYDFVIAVIDNLKEHFDPTQYTYNAYTYSNNYRSYPYDDYDDYGYYYGYSYDYVGRTNFKDYDKNKKHECKYCNTDTGNLQEFMLPDGSEIYICGFCFDDLESEIKRLKPKFDFLI